MVQRNKPNQYNIETRMNKLIIIGFVAIIIMIGISQGYMSINFSQYIVGTITQKQLQGSMNISLGTMIGSFVGMFLIMGINAVWVFISRLKRGLIIASCDTFLGPIKFGNGRTWEYEIKCPKDKPKPFQIKNSVIDQIIGGAAMQLLLSAGGSLNNVSEQQLFNSINADIQKMKQNPSFQNDLRAIIQMQEADLQKIVKTEKPEENAELKKTKKKIKALEKIIADLNNPNKTKPKNLGQVQEETKALDKKKDEWFQITGADYPNETVSIDFDQLYRFIFFSYASISRLPKLIEKTHKEPNPLDPTKQIDVVDYKFHTEQDPTTGSDITVWDYDANGQPIPFMIPTGETISISNSQWHLAHRTIDDIVCLDRYEGDKNIKEDGDQEVVDTSTGQRFLIHNYEMMTDADAFVYMFPSDKDREPDEGRLFSFNRRKSLDGNEFLVNSCHVAWDFAGWLIYDRRLKIPLLVFSYSDVADHVYNLKMSTQTFADANKKALCSLVLGSYEREENQSIEIDSLKDEVASNGRSKTKQHWKELDEELKKLDPVNKMAAKVKMTVTKISVPAGLIIAIIFTILGLAVMALIVIFHPEIFNLQSIAKSNSYTTTTTTTPIVQIFKSYFSLLKGG
jgi:hypothetical protein